MWRDVKKRCPQILTCLYQGSRHNSEARIFAPTHPSATNSERGLLQRELPVAWIWLCSGRSLFLFQDQAPKSSCWSKPTKLLQQEMIKNLYNYIFFHNIVKLTICGRGGELNEYAASTLFVLNEI